MLPLLVNLAAGKLQLLSTAFKIICNSSHKLFAYYNFFKFPFQGLDGERYSASAFAKMNAFRKRGQLCDVRVKVDGREFPAHRVVLAASSDYFDAMFSSGVSSFVIYLPQSAANNTKTE